MMRIQEEFKLKDDNIEPPDVYLGDTLAKMKFYSGKYCWIMSPEQFLKAAVTNVEEDLARSDKRFLSKYSTPFLKNYAPSLEDSTELIADSVKQ